MMGKDRPVPPRLFRGPGRGGRSWIGRSRPWLWPAIRPILRALALLLVWGLGPVLFGALHSRLGLLPLVLGAGLGGWITWYNEKWLARRRDLWRKRARGSGLDRD